MKGIILAGGNATRLLPNTRAVSKHLLTVYDKPMIYYPLSTLMLAGVRDIMLITLPRHLDAFQRLLGDGSQWGISLSYTVQAEPNGLAEAYILGADHVDGQPSALMLGDNIMHGERLAGMLRRPAAMVDGCVVFGYPVSDPQRFGVGVTDQQGRLVDLQEKPAVPRSNRAIVGLYFYDGNAPEIAKQLTPSDRGELEITDLNRVYLDSGQARLVDLGRDVSWFDMGTCDSMLDAANFVRHRWESCGERIGSPEEIALYCGYIDVEQCLRLGHENAASDYGQYVLAAAERRALSVKPGQDDIGEPDRRAG